MIAVHLDPLGGVAGDMFVAAMLDARPDFAAPLLAMLDDLATHFGASAAAGSRLIDHDDGRMRGKRFVVAEPAHRKSRQGAGYDHVRWSDLRAQLATAPLTPAVSERARAIFQGLAEAEGAVHGCAANDVSFHELGAWDSIADIVSAAWLIDALGAARWSCAPLPMGAGSVLSRHGRLPVPAPATAKLLAGFVLIDDGIEGERVTPTGAAILRHLEPSQQPSRTAARLVASGTGFGTRSLPGTSNVLRALVMEPVAQPATGADQVAVITFEIDDQSPEDLALALDRLRADPGVIDLLQLVGLGKKGRIAAHVQILARPESLHSVIARCFHETTTLGLRHSLVERAVLDRRQLRVAGDAGTLRVKLADRPGGITTAKAEIADVIDAGAGAEARAASRGQAESRALTRSRKSRAARSKPARR